MSTYSKHAEICTRFYDLTVDSEEVGSFVYSRSRSRPGERSLFIGGFFDVARSLASRGIDIAAVDYTDEMVEVGKKKLPGSRVEKADLRSLPYTDEFDCVFVVGRVFTHMIEATDLEQAFTGCRRSLRAGGRLFFDNYEDTKIQRTKYFNGLVSCGDKRAIIERRSSTTRISEQPYVVRWEAEYSGKIAGEPFAFSDSMLHRAFSREEVSALLPRFGFSLMEQGDNFDETSFYTLASAE